MDIRCPPRKACRVGEIQRLGGVGALQAPRDELVAPGRVGLGGAGSGAAQWRPGPLASGSRTARTQAAGADTEGRLSPLPAHQLASAREKSEAAGRSGGRGPIFPGTVEEAPDAPCDGEDGLDGTHEM